MQRGGKAMPGDRDTVTSPCRTLGQMKGFLGFIQVSVLGYREIESWGGMENGLGLWIGHFGCRVDEGQW